MWKGKNEKKKKRTKQRVSTAGKIGMGGVRGFGGGGGGGLGGWGVCKGRVLVITHLGCGLAHPYVYIKHKMKITAIIRFMIFFN